MTNLHGTAVVVGRAGVLILGPSGSGKTTLALELVRRAQGLGRFAALVADDQLVVSARSGRLLVSAPEPIAGLVEVHGLAPMPSFNVPSAVIDLACSLVPADLAPRYQEPGQRLILETGIAELVLPERRLAQSAAAVMAHLSLGFFAGMRQNG